jgi:hypothetical protein
MGYLTKTRKRDLGSLVEEIGVGDSGEVGAELPAVLSNEASKILKAGARLALAHERQQVPGAGSFCSKTRSALAGSSKRRARILGLET